MTRNQKHIVGKHAILELSGCNHCYNPDTLKEILIRAATAANAKVLGYHSHEFGLAKGYTGVLILAESHITFHTWEEYSYIAIDLFVCGQANINAAIDVISNSIEFVRSEIINIDRGYKTC